MSKQIQMEKPEDWSNDDKEYLLQRGRLPEPQYSEFLAQREAEAPRARALSSYEEPGDVNTVADGIDNGGMFGDLTKDKDEEKSYEEMSKKELQAELASRELSVSGTKDELIERLEEDDAEKEDNDPLQPEDDDSEEDDDDSDDDE